MEKVEDDEGREELDSERFSGVLWDFSEEYLGGDFLGFLIGFVGGRRGV